MILCCVCLSGGIGIESHQPWHIALDFLFQLCVCMNCVLISYLSTPYHIYFLFSPFFALQHLVQGRKNYGLRADAFLPEEPPSQRSRNHSIARPKLEMIYHTRKQTTCICTHHIYIESTIGICSSCTWRLCHALCLRAGCTPLMHHNTHTDPVRWYIADVMSAPRVCRQCLYVC